MTENFHGAIRDLSRAIKLDAQDASAYERRARLYRAIGKIKKAEADERAFARFDR